MKPNLNHSSTNARCVECWRTIFFRRDNHGRNFFVHDDLLAMAELENLDHMTICPNNAKIWILEPDMATLREI